MAGDIPDVYLRIDGLQGECNDVNHSGDDGWITIKSFNFGFGFEGTDAQSEPEEATDSTATGTTATGPANAPRPHPAQPRPKPKKKAAKMKSGPMTFDRISFSKSSDETSTAIMQACHDGTEIDKVELHACRYGGPTRAEKLPFLHMIFSKVHFKSCKLNLATEGMPSEDIEFEYAKVEVKCLWTDNATGNRLPDQPITVGWDLAGQTEIDVEPDDPD
jgi:type VI protein secretion system component Hcp